MSDILINGMEMPKVCYKNANEYCLKFYTCCVVGKFLDSAQGEAHEDIHHRRLEGCPLVEVKPHGRLGDIDKFKEWLHRMNGGRKHFTLDEIKIIEHFIDRHMPTIVEKTK